jgi:hypothetical protein
MYTISSKITTKITQQRANKPTKEVKMESLKNSVDPSDDRLKPTHIKNYIKCKWLTVP